MADKAPPTANPPSTAPSRVVILLVGLHGVGKSTFTRAATRREDIPLGRGLGPCTKKCTAYSFHHAVTINPGLPAQDFAFTIIDTPGLADNNTTLENLNVLQVIADQLRQLGQERVSGVIYFHSIEGARLHGIDMANLRLLNAISGTGFFPRVAFVTTRWDRMRENEQDMLEQRNAELEKARKDLLPQGPAIFKFLNDGKTHLPVLEYFAHKSIEASHPRLQFAEELDHYRMRRVRAAVKKTTAGKQVVTRGQAHDTLLRTFHEFIREMLNR